MIVSCLGGLVFHSAGYYLILLWMSVSIGFFMVCHVKYLAYLLTAVLQVHTQILVWHCKILIIQIKLSRVKNPNWQGANQLAIYKYGRGVKLTILPGTNPASVQGGIERGTSELQVQYSNLSATLPLNPSLDIFPDTDCLCQWFFIGSYLAINYRTWVCPRWDRQSKQKKNIPSAIYCCATTIVYVFLNQSSETSCFWAPQWPKGYPVKKGSIKGQQNLKGGTPCCWGVRTLFSNCPLPIILFCSPC